MVSNLPSLTHANRHAAGGPDAISPAAIGAQPAGNYASLGQADLDLWDRGADHADSSALTANTKQNYVPLGISNGVADATARPVFKSGKISSAYAGSNSNATYLQVNPTGKTVKYARARWTIAASGTTNTGTMGLLIWADDYSLHLTPAIVPDAICHLAVTPTGWTYSVVSSAGTFTTAGSGTFDTPLVQDGATVHTCEVVIDKANSTAYVYLPDGTVATVVNSLIGSLGVCPYAVWEAYRGASTDKLVEFTEWACDTRRDDRVARAKTDSLVFGAWQAITLSGSWVNLDTTGYTYPPAARWRREGSSVRIDAVIGGGAATFGAAMFTLPLAPAYHAILPVGSSAGGGQVLLIGKSQGYNIGAVEYLTGGNTYLAIQTTYPVG